MSVAVAVSMYNLEVSTLPRAPWAGALRLAVRCRQICRQLESEKRNIPTLVTPLHCCTKYGHTESCYYGFLFEFWTYHKSPVRNFSLFIIYLIPIMFGILCLMQQKPISMTIIDHPCFYLPTVSAGVRSPGSRAGAWGCLARRAASCSAAPSTCRGGPASSPSRRSSAPASVRVSAV